MNASLQNQENGGGNIPGQRQRRKWLRPATVIFAILAILLAADALFIEPFRIEITHYDIQGGVAAPLKIAHLTDLHTKGMGKRERQLLATLAAEKPDAIVITGDTLGNTEGNYENAQVLYEQFHAPLGVWFVRGNWENKWPLRREKSFYRDAGVRFLLNSSEELRPDVWMIGLDDPYTGTAKFEAAMEGVPSAAYKILLFHSPAFFDRVAGDVNLCLTGHTHGGQVRIPFIKPFWLPKGCGRFLEGWYQEAGSSMYVSRGLGTSVLPIRFLCRPEITFITIHPVAGS